MSVQSGNLTESNLKKLFDDLNNRRTPGYQRLYLIYEAAERITDLQATLATAKSGIDEISMRVGKENTELRQSIKKRELDCRTLADAVLQAEGILCNDLYRTRVKNAVDVLSEVKDEALNWMSEPPEG